jgi:hypothetical protein
MTTLALLSLLRGRRQQLTEPGRRRRRDSTNTLEGHVPTKKIPSACLLLLFMLLFGAYPLWGGTEDKVDVIILAAADHGIFPQRSFHPHLVNPSVQTASWRPSLVTMQA